MAFEDVMGTVSALATSMDVLAALGASLAIQESGAESDPETKAALADVLRTAGIDLDGLQPHERAMSLNMVRLLFHLAQELLEEPTRPAGWTYTDPVVLEGMGRGSGMLPGIMKNAIPGLTEVGSFLDVGTGVGFLAIAAANAWPSASVVGLDIWEPSLQRARENVKQSGLEDRITIREQDVTTLDDTNVYDCAWLPTFFFKEEHWKGVIARIVDALKPGGTIVLGCFDSPADPVARAVDRLQTVRGGGASLEPDLAIELLREAGCTDAVTIDRSWPLPVDFTVGRKPA